MIDDHILSLSLRKKHRLSIYLIAPRVMKIIKCKFGVDITYVDGHSIRIYRITVGRWSKMVVDRKTIKTTRSTALAIIAISH
jgi:hypothetical protein